MAQITLWGATYSDVPAVDLPATGGGTVRFYDVVDGDELEYGTAPLADLTGTTWTFNSYTYYSGSTSYWLDFTSSIDNEPITGYRLDLAYGGVFYSTEEYGSVEVERSGEWLFNDARTISITGGSAATSDTLIAWIEENAAQQ